jgi:2-phospho-L-lactate guanylyltransferase
VRTALVVPIKAPSRAKRRLDGVLNDVERWRLARAMASDVLEVVAGLRDLARLAVCDDPELMALAGRFGIETVIDEAAAGQSAAVRLGFQAAARQGHSPLVTIPGDVPAVSVEEIRALCEGHPQAEVLLAPDRDGVGTNGLRVPAADALPLQFGEDSLRLHREEAERAGLRVEVVLLPRLSCDLDRPADLAAFLRLRPDTATLALLEELQVADRLFTRDRPRG